MLDLSIKTPRLLLRPFRDSDAAQLTKLLAEWDVASMTGRIPYPYSADDAKQWLAGLGEKLSKGTDYSFCIDHNGVCIGAVGLHREGCAMGDNDSARTVEIGYWIGKPYWGHGFVSEATKAVVDFAFERLGQSKVVAGHFVDNPASGRVLAKLGFVKTGAGRHACVARNKDVDNIAVALTRDAWLAKQV